MRVCSVVSARRWLRGFSLLAALALVACSTSSSEQLLQAEKLLATLEAQGADQYLIYEIAELRRGVEEAKKDMRNNRAEIAGVKLDDICRRLDSCGVAFIKLKDYAENRSRQQLAFLGAQLQTLEGELGRFPKLTYVDQNRYDIHMHRLRRYQKDLKGLEALIAGEDFPEALEKGSVIQLQVAKIFSSLNEVPPEVALAEQRKASNRPKFAEQQSRFGGSIPATAQ